MSGDSDRDGDSTPRGDPDSWADVDVDTAFAAIVERYSQADPGIGPWPAAEDAEQTPPSASSAGSGSSAVPGPAPDPGQETSTGSPSERAPSGTSPSAGSGPPSGPEILGAPCGEGRGPTPNAAGAGGSGPGRPDEGTPGHQADRLCGTGPGAGATGIGDPSTDGTTPDGTGPADGAGPADEIDDLWDERFVPPEPPPLPRGDFVTSLGWVCVLGGPLFLVFAALTWRGVPGELILAAVAAFVGGFVLLVARMPGDHPDDPDDGAVV
jgi:hypothetical protein